MNICENCGIETKNPKFCCKSCANALNGKLHPKRKIAKKCSRCDNIVRNYRSLLCEDCYQNHLSNQKEALLNNTLFEYSERECIKKLHSSSKHVHIRQLARSWFKDLSSLPCANCGYKKHVELCHIKPIHSFSLDSKLKDVNSYENLIQLCPNCHWEFDNDNLIVNNIKAA